MSRIIHDELVSNPHCVPQKFSDVGKSLSADNVYIKYAATGVFLAVKELETFGFVSRTPGQYCFLRNLEGIIKLTDVRPHALDKPGDSKRGTRPYTIHKETADAGATSAKTEFQAQLTIDPGFTTQHLPARSTNYTKAWFQIMFD